jgi:hypothetical protein
MLILAKKLVIYQWADSKLKIKQTNRMFFNLMMDWLSNWKERIQTALSSKRLSLEKIESKNNRL